MFRAFTAASLLAASVTCAQAQTYTGYGPRIPYTANGVCGSLLGSRNETKLFYRNWYESCMRGTGAAITRQAQARSTAYPRYASR